MAVDDERKRLQLLPGTLQEIARVTSVETACKIADRFGGSTYKFPTKSRFTCLEEVVGIAEAEKLAISFGGLRKYIPMYTENGKKKLILLDLRGSVSEVARAAGCSQRWARRVRRLIAHPDHGNSPSKSEMTDKHREASKRQRMQRIAAILACDGDVAEVAKATGCSIKFVEAALREAGRLNETAKKNVKTVKEKILSMTGSKEEVARHLGCCPNYVRQVRKKARDDAAAAKANRKNSDG